MSLPRLHAHPLGDSAVTIDFGADRSPELLRRIHAAAIAVRKAALPAVDDVVPAYLSLSVFYDPLHASYADLADRLIATCEAIISGAALEPARSHVVPVRYDGVDLQAVATATGLAVEEVIALHSTRTYTVDLLGFVPGFAYLSELEPRLQLPRRPQPRPRVTAGSVAIAGAQTAVYPLDTPGGWHLIGSTTTVMFDLTRDPPALLAPGDRVRFERVQ